MAYITTEADAAAPAPVRPRLYVALQFSPATAEGRRTWIQILVPALSFDQALAALRDDQYLVGDGETYLLTDYAAERGPTCRTFTGSERYDAPTLEEHANWVRAMTSAYHDNGELVPATYIRVA